MSNETRISVPVALELAEKLKRQAKSNGRAVGREVENILQQAFGARRPRKSKGVAA